MPEKTVMIICPNLKCRAIVQVPERARGKRVRCGHCGIHFAIPTRHEGAHPDEAKQKTTKE